MVKRIKLNCFVWFKQKYFRNIKLHTKTNDLKPKILNANLTIKRWEYSLQ